MKTIYKSTTTLTLVSLLVFLLSFSVIQAEAQTSYIIVHAHNPEGVEIASIQGMSQNSVKIYDGDALIGYGAYNAETHNKPIAISPGGHTIKAKFNGMTLEQNININAGQTQVLTFTFERTHWDGTIYGISLIRNYYSEISGSFDGYYPDTWVEDITIDETRQFAKTSVRFACSHDWQAGVFHMIATMNINYSPENFTISASAYNWVGFTRGYHDVGVSPHNHALAWLLNLPHPFPTKEGSSFLIQRTDTFTISYDFRQFHFQIFAYADAITRYYNVNHPVIISTVPYDLDGTGVKDGENQPPVASFTYLPENPNVGEEITFDASSSYDPDGTIVKYEWDFGNGNSAEGEVVTYAYTQAGTYNVTLTVTDNDGLANAIQKVVFVEVPKISGMVFKDEDGNFIYNESEDIPIKDATVEAVLNGEVKATAITDENGYYSIEVSPGEGYVLEVSLPAGVECYDPEKRTWGNHSTIQGRAENVSPPATVNIPVTYQPLNYGPKNFLWELWHYGPIFVDKPNVILVHGTQLYIRPPFIPIGPHFGDGKVRGMPDNEFHELDDLLQKKQYGQFNVWEFEYADTKIGRRYWTHGDIIDYGVRLANALDYVGSLSNSGVSIIAHSLGGLVTRYAAQNYPESNYYKVDKIITLATGHFGFEYTRPIPVVRGIPTIVQMQPGSQFLWDINSNFKHGSFRFLSIAADNDDFVSQTSASLVECNENRSVNYDPNNTYFTVIPGDHASIKNIEDDMHYAFAEIVQFLNLGYSSNIWSPTGSPYFTFRLTNPTRGGYPRVWIEESGRWILPWQLDMYSTYDRRSGYYAWTFRARPDEEGLLKIYYARDRYEEGWLTQGQSAIRKQIIENR